MDKETWKQHIEREGMYRPSRGGDKELWKSIVLRHKTNNCPICKERANTIKKNNTAATFRQTMKGLGLTRVIGAVSGKVYYE